MICSSPSRTQLITYAADETDPWEYYWVGFNGACANKLAADTVFRGAPQYTTAGICRPRGKRCTTSIFPAGRFPLRGNDDGLPVHIYGTPDEGSPRGHAQWKLVKQPVCAGRHQVYPIQLLARYLGGRHCQGGRRQPQPSVSCFHVECRAGSPSTTWTNYRVSEACSLLKNSGLSIAEIAVSVGFFDQFYFSRVFKKVKGVPPSKYLSALEKETVPQNTNP